MCTLKASKNLIVDKLLHILFRIARKMIFEQMLKEEKGKITHCLCEIHKRHKHAVEMAKTSTVTQISKNEWKLELQR